MTAYYNEIDPYAAQWLRNLISAGRIAPGDIDERDIRDVHPDDLRRYVGRLRAYGNAIVAQAAATFIGAYVEASMTL